MQSLKLNGVNHFNQVNKMRVCLHNFREYFLLGLEEFHLLTAGCFVDVFNEFHKELLCCTVYVMFLSMLQGCALQYLPRAAVGPGKVSKRKMTE